MSSIAVVEETDSAILVKSWSGGMVDTTGLGSAVCGFDPHLQYGKKKKVKGESKKEEDESRDSKGAS